MSKYTSIKQILDSIPQQHWREYYDDMLPVAIAFAGTHPVATHLGEINRLITLYKDTIYPMLPTTVISGIDRDFYIVQALSNRTGHTHVHILCLKHACIKIGGASGLSLFQALMGKAIEDTPLHHVIDRS